MTSSLKTIDHLKELTIGLSNSPIADYKKITTMFEAIGEVVSILTAQNKEQKELLKNKDKLEQQCKTNESKYKILFDNAPDAIFLMQREICVDCNNAALQMFCCQKKDLLGASPLGFSPRLQPDGSFTANKVDARVTTALQGRPQGFKWRFLKKDTTPFDAWVRLNKIEMNGGDWLIAWLHEMVKRER